MTDDDDADRTRGRRFAAWLRSGSGAAAVVALLLLILAGWKGAEGYGMVKSWRAEYLLAEADRAAARGDDAEARRFLRRAGMLVGRQPATLRAVARFCARRHEPVAVEYFEALGRTGEATVEDWIIGTREAFRFAMFPQAERGLQALAAFPEAATRPAVLALKAEALAWEGQWAEALVLARQAVAGLHLGEGDDERLLLARLTLRPPLFPPQDRPALQKESLGILSDLASRPDASGWLALQILETLIEDAEMAALLRGAAVQPWMDAAARNPYANAVARVKCWDLRLAAEPERRETILRELFERASGVSAGDQLEISRWLIGQRAYSLAEKLAAPSRLKSEEWFMVYLEAVAGGGDWETVLGAVTASHEGPLSAAVRRLFQLRAEKELHRDPDAGFAWNAIRLALNTASPQQELYVATCAERSGFVAEAAEIYRRLLKDGEFPARLGRRGDAPRLAFYLGVVRTVAGEMTTSEVAKFFRKFAGEFPEMDDVQNEAAYLQLLLGAESGDEEAEAQRLTRQHPQLLTYRTTAALADLRRQRFGEAGKWYDDLDVDWRNVPDRYNAIRAAVLEANGRAEEAAKIRARLRPEALRPEERELAGLR